MQRAQFDDVLKTLTAARYADIRITDSRQQVASLKNGHVDGLGA